MVNRRKLQSATFYYKILLEKQPSYLYRKIVFREDVHNLNIRFKGTITPPRHKTALFERSFRYQISKFYNSLSPELKTLSAFRFKKQYKTILLNKQLLWYHA